MHFCHGPNLENLKTMPDLFTIVYIIGRLINMRDKNRTVGRCDAFHEIGHIVLPCSVISKTLLLEIKWLES